MIKNNNIYVAKLGKTVGLKGHLRLFIDSDFPEQFKKGNTFYTNRNLTLKISEFNSTREVIKFEGYDDVELSKKLINQELYVTIEQTRENCKLGKNEFFWFDLIGCDIFEDDLKLGKVNDVFRYPLNDYLEVYTSQELIEKDFPKVFLIPHIFEQFIISVNIENKSIYVKDSMAILENS